jgi:hypothetical protein
MNTEQKTPIEWFQQLKEPYRSEAIENISNRMAGYVNYPSSLLAALNYSFDWMQSPQKLAYWEKIYDSIKSGETTYLETELKPQDMISGEWYVVETKNEYLIKFKTIEGMTVIKTKCYIYNRKQKSDLNALCHCHDIKSIRPATREEVLEHFPDEFQDEKKIPYSVYQPLFKLMSKEHNVSLLPTEMEEIINLCEKILEARKDEKKEVESELKDGEVYFYYDRAEEYIITISLDMAINRAVDNTTIYKATPIGTKQTKAILVPIKTK